MTQKENTRKIKKQKRKIFIATYNTRTMRNAEHLEQLEKALSNIKWHILGLSETRLPGEKYTTLQSKHTLYQYNNEANSKNGQGGVAILIHKSIQHMVCKTKAISERVVYIILELNNRYKLQVIQAYAPTATSSNEEIELFYEDITRARRSEEALLSHHRRF